MKKPTAAQIQQTIRALLANGQIEWSAIVQVIEGKYTIRDWVTQVRNPMQAMIAAGEIRRIRDIRREIYAKTDVT